MSARSRTTGTSTARKTGLVGRKNRPHLQASEMVVDVEIQKVDVLRSDRC